MLWEHELLGECFYTFFEFSQAFVSASATITSTAHASPVFLLSYRNMVLNQSAPMFSLGYFFLC